MSEIKYKRILLKVSGEALGEKTAAGDGFGLDFAKINDVCASIKECVDMVFRLAWSLAEAISGGVSRMALARCSVPMLMPWVCWLPL